MTIKSTIECPRCGATVHSGLSMPVAGSYLDCKKCGYTVAIKADDELSVKNPPPPAPEPGTAKFEDEAEFETLTPIEEIPATSAPPATPAPTTPKAAPCERPPHTTTRETLRFTGSAGEYFKIWIVNIALTIVTLGIYSAWAKVRNNRYFYGNTRLMGSAFEYHAEAKKILKGRALVFALFALYSLAKNFMPIAGAVLSIALVFIVPWFVIKSMKFRARNSSYRNIRFNFEATYKEALKTFVGYGALSTITLGVGYPHFVFKRKEFTIGHSRYGTTPFKFKNRSWNFYKIYIKALLLIVLLIAGFALSAAVTTLAPGKAKLFAFLPFILPAATYLLIFAYLKTAIDNLSLSSASIGKSRLESTMRVRDMAWIYISNAAIIVLTLGLMTPWAKVRSKRYKIEHLHLYVGEDFDAFIADEQKEPSTFGEEAIDFLDFDIGL